MVTRLLLACLLLPVAALAQTAQYPSSAEVRPLVLEIGPEAPADLPALTGPQAAAAWLAWIGERDDAIRRRLSAGDEDTLVNWILLGTSFTTQPPVRLDGIDGTDERAVDRAIQVILLRVDDVMVALASPGADERRLFARRLLEGQGQGFGTSGSRAATRDALVGTIQRVMEGASSVARREQALQQTRAEGRVPTSEFEGRGLSLDTSLAPNFAVHESLEALKARGLLGTDGVRRVAIIGAGLDFADKNTGFDFYPVQTLQPFAVLDSLRRLDLVPSSGGVVITALDISSRVIEHITRARASAGAGYTLRLPLSRARPWLPSFRAYWEAFGGRIGTPVAATVPAGVSGEVDLKAIRLEQSVVESLAGEDVNIIVERPAGPPYDLVIATNVLLYYGTFDRALALANIGVSLAPGGLLLSNTDLPAVASSGMRRIGSQITRYTSDNTGDEMIWYQRDTSAMGPGR